MERGDEGGRGGGGGGLEENISAERVAVETDFSWAARMGDVILINTNPSTLPSLFLALSLSPPPSLPAPPCLARSLAHSLSLLRAFARLPSEAWSRGLECHMRRHTGARARTHLGDEHTDERKLESRSSHSRAKRSATLQPRLQPYAAAQDGRNITVQTCVCEIITRQPRRVGVARPPYASSSDAP